MLAGLIIAIVLALLFFVIGLRLNYQKNKLVKLYALQTAKMDANSDPVKEDFLKFVSDSREWAYTYIEEVQEALTNFKNQVDPLVQYFDTYGDVISNQRPDYEAMKTISSAYKELILILPKEHDVKT
jgi:hypothetical protein